MRDLNGNAVLSRHCVVLVTAALTAFIGLLSVGVVNVAADEMGIGEGPSADYSGEDCGTDHIDPVGVMFRGKWAGPENVANKTAKFANWLNESNAGAQDLKVKESDGVYRCRETDMARSSHNDILPGSRFHVRLWFIPATAGHPKVRTVGTPHHEDLKICGHAVDQNGPEGSGFDIGRQALKRAFVDYNHKVRSEKWGNTLLKEQCDGGWAGSNGWGVNIWSERKMAPEIRKPGNPRGYDQKLMGSLATDEATTEWWFGYGVGPARGVSGYPKKTDVKTISGAANTEVSAEISGLFPNTTYYVRLFARNQDGEVEESPEMHYSTYGSPVAAYSLDTGEGTVAEDLFGEHDGEIEGADWFANGRYGQALSFDSGEEDCVTVEDAPDLQLTEEFTLGAWVRPKGEVKYDPIFFKEAEGFFSYSLGLGLSSSGKLEAYIGDEEEEVTLVNSPSALPSGVWAHVALTFDGAKMRLYLNGELVDTNTLPPESGNMPSTGPLEIGCSDLFNEYFNGLIDEVRVYNRALSGGEIVTDAGTGLLTPLRSPVAAYAFDENEGAVAGDLFGDHHGAIEGADWFANGRFGSALSFDSGEEDCVTVEDAPDLQLTEEFTIEAWAKPTGSGEVEPLIYKETEGFFSYSLFLGLQESGKVEGLLGDEEEEIGPDVESDQALPANVWAHVALTYDGAKLRLYVNGELQDTTTAELGAFPSSGPLTIGCADHLEFEDFYNGLIDEVRVYNRALGAGEVAADGGAGLQTPSRSPVAAYSLDAGEGAVAEDVAGEHDGEIEGADWFANGRYGQALSFDSGEEDCVTVEDAPDLQLTEEFTLGAWVRPKGEVKYDPIFFKEAEGFFSYSLGLGLASSGKLEAYIGDEEEEVTLVDSPSALPSGVWAHVALTFDGAKMRLYLNGELVDTNSTPPEGGNMPSTGPLEIGCSDLFNEYFNGLIDEVRVYNRALGAGEVAADGGAGLQTPSRSPVAAYSLDAGEGAVAEDVAGEHDGEIEGADWFANGRYGQALSFDSGEEDCVTVPDSPDLQLTEEFTLQAWVRPEGEVKYDPIFFKEAEGFFSYSLGLGLASSGKLEAYIGDEEEEVTLVDSPSALPTGVWAHVALTFDGAKMRLYLNGELVDTNSTPPEGGNMPSTGPLEIGCSDLFNEYFNGLIDEVRVYNRALSGGEIASDGSTGLEVPARSPVAAYSLDAGEGAVAEDIAGEHDGAIEGADWFANGRFGQALSFDSGEEDCVTVEDAPDLQLTEEFTLQAWVRPEGEVKYDPIFFKEAEGFFSYSLGLGLSSSGKLEAYIGDEEEEVTLVNSPSALTTGVWAHVALTFDGAKMRLYLNGELVDTNSTPPEGGNMPSTGPLEIGCSDLFNEYFNGLIDEVRVYNRALDGGEVGSDLVTPVDW